MPERHMRFTIDDDNTVRLDGGRPGADEWPCLSPEVAEKVALRHATRSAEAEGDEINVTLETPLEKKQFVVTLDGAEPATQERESSTTASPMTQDQAPVAGQTGMNTHQTSISSTLGNMQAGASKVKRPTDGPTGVLDQLRDLPLGAKIAAGVVALLLLATLVSLPFRGGKDDQQAAAQPAAATTPVLPDGCLGGQDVVAGVRAAGPLASSSTITQNGLTVPSPSGAAAAAAAFARLRSTLPVPEGRDAAAASILAPDATAAAKQGIPSAPGWTTHLDMTKARWRVVSGDGQSAGIDLLLTSVGTQNGKESAPAQFAVHVDLALADGQWRLKDVGAPKDTNSLATAHIFRNAEACS